MHHMHEFFDQLIQMITKGQKFSSPVAPIKSSSAAQTLRK